MKAQIKPCLFGLLLSGLVLAGCAASENSSVSALKADQQATPAPLQPLSERQTGQPVVSIDSIKSDQADETVAIAGNITQRVALLEGWLYQVQDQTGSVWVVASNSEPEIGQSALIEGIVRYEAIVVDSIDAGEVYLEEQAYLPGEG